MVLVVLGVGAVFLVVESVIIVSGAVATTRVQLIGLLYCAGGALMGGGIGSVVGACRVVVLLVIGGVQGLSRGPRVSDVLFFLWDTLLHGLMSHSEVVVY